MVEAIQWSLGSTIDRLLYDIERNECVVLEIKCPFVKTPEPHARPRYIAQVLMQCAAWGCDYGYLWVYQGNKHPSVLFRIDFIQELWDNEFLPALEEFWEYVETKDAPPRMISGEKGRLIALLESCLSRITL